jgi:Fe-S cluster assembly protein SufD
MSAVAHTSTSETLGRIREQAASRFEQLGWPTPRLEAWKYTNLAAAAKQEWQRAAGVQYAEAGMMSMAGGAMAELVFVDGIYAPEASTLSAVEGLRVTTLGNADPELLERHFARYADYQDHAMTALNTANVQDGAVIEVSGTVEGFVHLLFLGTDGFGSHPRNLIVAGRGAQLAVVESYGGCGRYFVNAVTEIVAGDGAVIDHTKLSCDSSDAFHVGTVQIHQERASSVVSRNVAIGGSITRNDINGVLAGEGANLVLDGLFVGTAAQHLDSHTVIDHARPHCESIELYKGVLDQQARGIFDGRIIVRPDARKTVSRQTNKNLLLSETAIVDSKPTLEIFNDDVKCNHGSTIGQLDEESLFYLRSRGIDAEEARSLLVYAFASEIVERIRLEPVREQVRRAMFRQMPDRLPERRAGKREE